MESFLVFKCKAAGKSVLGLCVNVHSYKLNMIPFNGFWFCKTDITILYTDSSHVEGLYIAECHGFPDLCCPLSST